MSQQHKKDAYGGISKNGFKSNASKPQPSGSKTTGKCKALVPASSKAVSSPHQTTMLVGSGPHVVEYKARPVQAAKNYDVISFARAMNDDFGPRVQRLFAPETDAAMAAVQTGIYIGWRCSDFKHDCQRVSVNSKCFCGHLLGQHGQFNGQSVRVPCKEHGCKCQAFAWIPSRPEEVGEFWFQRRRNFDPSSWRANCRCKHNHEEHDCTSYRKCKLCRCGSFESNFLCAACDRHWEEHETFFDNEKTRREKGLPVGEDYIPFNEIPSLKQMVLTGHDDEDMSYMKQIEAPYDPNARVRPVGMTSGALPGPSNRRALPPSSTSGNDQPFKPGFKPVYD